MLGFALVPGSEDEAVVITQDGDLWRVHLKEPEEAEAFGDISGLLAEPLGPEEGLLGIAFSPNYEDDSAIYLYYSSDTQRTVLSRFQVTDDQLDMGSEQQLLQIDLPFLGNHRGGQVAFGPDGMLYLGVGDGGLAYDPHSNGQDLSDLLASILRIDVSGGGDSYDVPPDNPFVSTPGALPEVYAYGLRNPWRFSFDSETDELWAGDVGQDVWEEVNRVTAGGNYGWKIMEGNACFQFNQSAPPPLCDRTPFVPPRTVYGREQGCAIIGGYVYRGDAMPELYGHYIYGDFCTGTIWAVDTESDVSPPVLIADGDVPISSFAELRDGEILVITYAEAIYQLQQTAPSESP
jgi:glucose/arabinose dehydrogenase